MSKPEQVLIIDPQSELKFRGPFNVPVTSYMKLTNPSDKKVLFKIKTTAPKKYCVRPNSGVLDPKSVIEIAICLQPFIFDPAEKNKHKFMVQTVFAPEGDVNLDALWKDISPDQLMDSKLKCVFEMPVVEGGTNAAPQENNVETVVEAKEKREVKSSPKVTGSFIPSQADTELQKAAQEVKLLREEESSLRQENLQLKEEILRLKHNIGASPGMAAAVNTKYNPTVQAPSFSMMYIAVAVGIALFGIILGKFIL